MKSTYALVLSVLFVVVLFSPTLASAKQIEYYTTDFPDLGQSMYQMGIISQGEHSVQGWMIMSEVSASVLNRASVTRLDTNALMNDGDEVEVGTRLRLTFDKHNYTDIYWFGTGGAQDSPYGNWREGATAPPRACDAADKINNTPYTAPQVWTVHYDNGSDYRFLYDNFVEFVISPPEKTITPGSNLGSCSALSENADGTVSMECTVTGAGALNPVFNYDETLGDFYYRIEVLDGGGDWPEGCFGTSSDMRQVIITGGFGVPTSYDFVMPAQSIPFSFTAVEADNQSPNAPTIAGSSALTCVTPGTPVSTTFTLSATDPDGDQIRYNIDTNNNGVPDVSLPSATTYVSSGTSQSYTRASLDSYSFRVQVQDPDGSVSAWVTKSVTVTPCATPAPTALLTASPGTVASGGSSTLTWSCSGTATSASIDQSIGALTPSDGSWAGTPNGGTRSTGALTTAKTYTLTCVGPGGQTSDTETVTVGDPVTNGVCSATHYACTTGTSTSNVDGATAWTWTCQGSGTGSTNASCTENKPVSAVLPNLTASSVTVPDAEINDPVTISALIRNESATTTGVGFTNLFQIDDNADHTTLIASRNDTSPRLLANGTDTSQVSYTFTTAGTWYVRACADKLNRNDVDGDVDESNENDNCSDTNAWTTVNVSEPSLSCDVSTFTDTNVNGDIDPGESVRFAASPASLGASAYTWDPSNAPAESGKGSTYNISFPASGTYQMRVSASGYEDGVCSVPVGQGQCDAEAITLSATPGRVQSGSQTTLSWEIPGVDDGITQCTITSNKDDSYSVLIPIPPGQCTTGDDGSEDSHAITTQTTFTLSCGGTTATVTVDVIPVIKET